MEEGPLRELLVRWGLTLARVRPDLGLAGSPQRCLWRSVVEDAAGRLFVLEQVAASRVPIKTRIAETLAYLADHGLNRALAYLRSREGTFLVVRPEGGWQVAPYVAGEPLERPVYVQDAWRGAVLAAFLADLRRAARGLPLWEGQEAFALERFARHLAVRLQANDPAVYARLGSVWRVLGERLFPYLDKMPLAFCHGDLHPLNVIWTCQDIAAVIDWEFSGLKLEGYDLANLIGCVGVEDPAALHGGLVAALLAGLRESSYQSVTSWQLLPELVLATRLVWLSEWLRNRDAEMVALELDYMDLLLGWMSTLRFEWRVERSE